MREGTLTPVNAPGGPVMRRLAVAAAVFLVVAACGDDAADPVQFVTTGAVTTAGTTAPPTTAPTTTAPPTTAPSTTAPPTTIPPTTAPPTTVPPTTAAPTAADALAAFFAAAADLDGRISDAAGLYNAQWDAGAGTLGAGARAAIDALDATTLKPLIPAGLSPDLEVAVLAVFADLDSRIAALDGGARYPGDEEFVRICLGLGGESADRFDSDLAAAQALALLEPPPTAAPDSPTAGVLEVRLTGIQSMNWGCDGCGGVAYTAPMEVDWAGRTVAGVVEFDATFNGTAWEILIYAC